MSTTTTAKISPDNLRAMISKSALSLRGYNQTNLGRTFDLLVHPRYGDVIADFLQRASRVCSEVTGKRVSLVDRVRRQEETNLDSYAEAVSLIVAVELGQLELLKRCFDIDYRRAMFSLGFSLGEIAAVVAGGLLSMEDALRVPLAMAEDCVALAENVSLAVLFSREQKLPVDEVLKQCQLITAQGQGTIGVSTILAPNSVLVLGQGQTLERLREELNRAFPKQFHLRINQGQWPPLHTSIMWQRSIPNRSALMLQQIQFHLAAPVPPIMSLVTGKLSYDKLNALDLIHRWVDHPQRLWDAIYESLVMGVETFLHIGPEPNIVPATLKRLKDNVDSQARDSIGMRALSAAAHRPWLQMMLPQRTALLRAASVIQINLEDWLLEQQDFLD